MPKTKLFISSVQVEFAKERQALYDYILPEPIYLKGYIERMGYCYNRYCKISQRKQHTRAYI
jgi:hypothetical protein